ncbi:hypothetical protein GLAREA_11457 [Glarea lozoyensis ATCC 20868]|uniref:Heterokaryon incompatibility domain-containing protein n=1 Tax=Glarea lozoyensis (strain ATCC 20868 / MF5171) TaxID=1116229 RepID=S3CYI4_GLAL2|nr:uncharacterized protein GLAREA_11457 [Glarea lozoyensis ATCC 20868]EPE24876.1 hypothetical protein GLAREA_11457 [Glarea lozoyensis ATCC 20868]
MKQPHMRTRRLRHFRYIPPRYAGMEPYTYKPLSAGEIRLLKVDKIEPDIEITIEEVNLDANPSYITLSYCWEGQKPSKTIIVNESRLLVTKNVHEILHTMYTLNHGDYFWIDAVCIDQENVLEKTVQIPMMTEIYSRCMKGVAWVGPQDPSITKAVVYMPELVSKMRGYPTTPALSIISELFVSEFEVNPDFLGFGNLLKRPWFRRIWVVQEFVLPCKVELLCGLDFVDPDLLHFILDNDFFFSRLVSHEILHYGQKIGDWAGTTITTGIRGYIKMCQLRASKIDIGASWTGFNFMEVLGMLSDLSALDGHDKVYGVLGILERYWRDNLVADYSIEVGKLYTSAFALHLRKEGRPSFLNFVCPAKTLVGLPSWCTNLLTPCDPDSLMFPRGTGGPYSSPDPDYRAGIVKDGVLSYPRPSVSDSSCNTENSILNISGFILDCVAQVVLPGPLLDKDENSSFEWMSECMRLSQRKGLSPLDVKRTHERTISAGRYYKDHKWSPISDLYGLYHSHVRYGPGTNAALMERTARRILRQMPVRGRTYFSTEGGSVGLGSSLVRPGDNICIFYNEPTPYIIRALSAGSDHYSFIGEAYVDGVMHGEALESEKAQNCRNFALV